jgi:LAO/AO transport system kinase
VPPGELLAGIASGDRAALGRALTLVESTAEDDREPAERFLASLPPDATSALRIGITGAPGAGKSTLLEALGTKLVGEGHRVGILAIDPSSGVSGGSILGDKTRMSRLARESAAFIRPTPSSGALGGVAPGTREGVRVLEAAGYDVVIVETVGVGQSEVEVTSLVDTLVWITGPNAGDELQAIKRGLVETVDVVLVNKSDGERVPAAMRARAEIEAALHYVTPATKGWSPRVLTVSALEGTGLDEAFDAIRAHRAHLDATQQLVARRREQVVVGFRRAVERAWASRFRARPELASIEQELAAGTLSLHAAIERALRIV